MAVPDQNPFNVYTANGVTTVFPYEFYLINADDLTVSLDGEAVSTGFTVTGIGNVNGGEVTFLTPPANDVTVMLERVVAPVRLTEYQDNGDLLADTVNLDFDRLWMAIKQSFVSLGVALLRPVFGGPFNAKGYRIANLSDPVNDQDAATKKWTQEQGTANLNKALRIPGSYIAPLPPLADGEAKTIVIQGGAPRWITPESGTATDVLLQLASNDQGEGAYLSAWKRNQITEAIQTVGDWLDAQPVDAYELALLITDRPDPDDPTTWDWSPVFAAVDSFPAANAVQLNLPAHAIRITETAVFSRGILLRGQGMHRTVINFDGDTDYAINFNCPSTRFEYFEAVGISINAKYGITSRWDNNADISNNANPFRSVRIKDCKLTGFYDPATDPLSGTMTPATDEDLFPFGVGVRLVMAYGAIVEGCIFDSFGIAFGNWGCSLSQISGNRFRNNARHIHDERVTWYNSSFGIGQDNAYFLNDILDGRRFGAVTFKNCYGTKFYNNYIEHLNRAGSSSSSTAVDFINTSHIRFIDNHINAYLAYVNSQPFAKFNSGISGVVFSDCYDNIIENNYLTPFDNVNEVVVDFDAGFVAKNANVLLYKNNTNWPILNRRGIMTEVPRLDFISANNLHSKMAFGGVLSTAYDAWLYDSATRTWHLKHSSDALGFTLRCNNPDLSTRFALVVECDDVAASGGNGRCSMRVIDEDGTVLISGQQIATVTGPTKYVVSFSSALSYRDKRFQIFIDGSQYLRIISVKLQPFTWSERGKTYEPGVIAAGGSVFTTVTVPGAVAGDFAEVSFNSSYQGTYAAASVSSANTVGIRFVNPTGASVTVPSGFLLARVAARQHG